MNEDADLDALISNLRAAVISGVQEEAAASANAPANAPANAGMNVSANAGPAAAGAGAGNNVRMASRRKPGEKWASLPTRAPSSRRAAVEATARRTEELMLKLKEAEDKKFARQAKREAANYKQFIAERIPALYTGLPRNELVVLQKKLVKLGEPMAAAEVGKLIENLPRPNGPFGGKRKSTQRRVRSHKKRAAKRKGTRRS